MILVLALCFLSDSKTYSPKFFNYTIDLFGLSGKFIEYEFEAPNDLELPNEIESYFCHQSNGMVELFSNSIEKKIADIPIPLSFKKNKRFKPSKNCFKKQLVQISILGTQERNNWVYALLTFEKKSLTRNCTPYLENSWEDKHFLLIKYSRSKDLILASRVFYLVH